MSGMSSFGSGFNPLNQPIFEVPLDNTRQLLDRLNWSSDRQPLIQLGNTRPLVASNGPSSAPPPPAPPPPVPQPASVSELQNYLRSIPLAVPGAVISSEYHNALRSAVLALGQALGVTFSSPFDVLSLTPSFHNPSDNTPGWTIGDAQVSAMGIDDVMGWQSVSLPDGAAIKSLLVTGQRSQILESLIVSLLSYEIGKPANPTSIVSIEVKPTTSTTMEAFSQEEAPIDTAKRINPILAAAILQPPQLLQMTRINNEKQRYVLKATAKPKNGPTLSPPATPYATIESIQIRLN